ncbi:MAG: UDP-N-acetylmuramoyl-L-alanine--D-glutamate ligase, partial [Actinomycetota bacterium]
MTTLVYGLAVAGRSTAKFLAARGERVVVADDRPSVGNVEFAASIGAELLEGPDAAMACARRMGEFARLAPSPGVPEAHPVIVSALRAGIEVVSEIELAYRHEQASGRARPIVAVTGTDGKTTTTLMAAAMLAASGRKAAAVGNTETPWVEVLDEPHDCFAVECSSFRLHYTRDFRAQAAAWLNLAPDHLDWHRDLESYRNAKARIWAAARVGDVAIAPIRDESIQQSAHSTAARVVTFGLEAGDYRVESGALVGPHGRIIDVGQLSRALPHDMTNALTASALVLESGLGTIEGVANALARYHHAPHRIQFVAEVDGVSYYNDSKAT